MTYNILIGLRQELVLALLIFLLLFIKLGKDRSNESILNFINIALALNLSVGLLSHESAQLFNGMFNTNALIVFEKVRAVLEIVYSYQSLPHFSSIKLQLQEQ